MIYSFIYCLGGNVKYAWRNLKTSFNGYKRKQQTATGLAAEDAPKMWKFFDQMASFLISVPDFADERYVHLNIIVV